MNEQQIEVLRSLRHEGHAVVVFTPEEIHAGQKYVEERLVELGWEVIESLASTKPDGIDEVLAKYNADTSFLPHGYWAATLGPDDQVWWNDPDHGKSSGYYKVASIPDDGLKSFDDIVSLWNEAGSEAEVFVRELAPWKPADLLPVVDGVSGQVDAYGYARTRDEAMGVGNESFTDEVVDAYLAENVTLADGSVLPKAWVALTSPRTELCRLVLTLDVTYNLNGVDAEVMKRNLRRMVESAIGNGMLTGDTEAEVDEYTMDVTAPPYVDGDEVANYILQRIEDGNLKLEDIPTRMARYGLMQPDDFAIEMRERLDMVREDAKA